MGLAIGELERRKVCVSGGRSLAWRVGASLDGPCAKFRLFCTHAQAAVAPQQRNKQPLNLSSASPANTHTCAYTFLHTPLTHSHTLALAFNE